MRSPTLGNQDLTPNLSAVPASRECTLEPENEELHGEH